MKTGCGSYRLIAKGLYEVRWRPHGLAGPHRSKRVRWPLSKIRRFLLQQADIRDSHALGLSAAGDWEDAIRDYQTHLQAMRCTTTYIAQVVEILNQLSCLQPRLDRFATIHATKHFDQRAIEVKGRTVNKELAMAGGFFRFCVRRLHAIPFNPLEAIDEYPETKPTKRHLTPAEYAAVWHASEPETRDLMDWQVLTAARIGEIAAMTWQDVNQKARVWVIPDRKGNDSLTVQLDATLLEILMRQRRPGRPVAGRDLVWRRWVAPKPDGKRPGHGFQAGGRIRKEWWNELLKIRCERAGVAPYSSHALRRAASDWARDAGVDMGDIQLLLGHTSVTTTEGYAPGSQTGRDRAAQAVLAARNAALKGAVAQ